MGPRINSYMLKKYAFDPRRMVQFYDTLFEHSPTLTEMRTVGDMSPGYYELWKVKKDFGVQEFFDFFQAKMSKWGRLRSLRLQGCKQRAGEFISCLLSWIWLFDVEAKER